MWVSIESFSIKTSLVPPKIVELERTDVRVPVYIRRRALSVSTVKRDSIERDYMGRGFPLPSVRPRMSIETNMGF